MPDIDLETLRRQVGTFAEPVRSCQADPAEPADMASERGQAAQVQDQGMFDEDPARRAVLGDCHKLLAGTQYTEYELSRKLRGRDHEQQLVEWALERCRAAGLVDDVRYAERYVESRIRRGHGAARIRADLSRRGIRGATLDRLLAEAVRSGELDDAAIEAARRKALRLDLTEPRQRARVARHLAGRGFGPSQIEAALRAIAAEHAG